MDQGWELRDLERVLEEAGAFAYQPRAGAGSSGVMCVSRIRVLAAFGRPMFVDLADLFGLHVIAPPAWEAIRTAAFRCRCGFCRRAVGHQAVLGLETNHHQFRPLRPLTSQAGRKRPAT